MAQQTSHGPQESNRDAGTTHGAANSPRSSFQSVRRVLKAPSSSIRTSLLLIEVAQAEAANALQRLGSSGTGLSEDEATLRLERYGENVVTSNDRHSRLRLFIRAVLNPLVLLLAMLAAVSLLTGDTRAASVMAGMIVLGVGLRFAQETRANTAADQLRAMIRVTATVMRDGRPREEPLARLVPGDIVQLSAGDMIPADVRILTCRDLFVTQASLTGESLPVEKFETAGALGDRNALEIRNLCFLGTSVESGTATAVVVETGSRTYLGAIASTLSGEPVPTSFDRGVANFTWLMIRFIVVMAPLVFIINGLTKHDWKEAFFFALAVAVGLTPEMLPMIVSVCLSRGALIMSRKKVIVKRLNSIQNLGAMDVLCTDKTGTLTQDRVILERHCDVACNEDIRVLVLAYRSSATSSSTCGWERARTSGTCSASWVPASFSRSYPWRRSILTNNLLYDFSQVPIPTDDVDSEQIAAPRPWSMHDLTRFILFIGPCSSVFDYTTFFIMLYVFGCWDPARAALFQTGWFVESLLTQTLIIHVIRTNRLPFLRSHASVALMATTAGIMLVGLWLPSSSLAPALGFEHLPHLYWPLIAVTLIAYVGLTQAVKMWLHRRRWI